jgi:hypothetical protein
MGERVCGGRYRLYLQFIPPQKEKFVRSFLKDGLVAASLVQQQAGLPQCIRALGPFA